MYNDCISLFNIIGLFENQWYNYYKRLLRIEQLVRPSAHGKTVLQRKSQMSCESDCLVTLHM